MCLGSFQNTLILRAFFLQKIIDSCYPQANPIKKVSEMAHAEASLNLICGGSSHAARKRKNYYFKRKFQSRKQ